MFFGRLTFLQTLISRSCRQSAPTAEYIDETEHEMATFRAKKPPRRPPLRARLFSVTSTKSARSGRSARSARSARTARSARSNPRGRGERGDRHGPAGHCLSGSEQAIVHPLHSTQAPSTPIRTHKKPICPPTPKPKRRRFARSSKIPARPSPLKLPPGPEKDSLDGQASELLQRITHQRRRLAADLEDCVKPFPR